jgi:hypothetical protein
MTKAEEWTKIVRKKEKKRVNNDRRTFLHTYALDKAM